MTTTSIHLATLLILLLATTPPSVVAVAAAAWPTLFQHWYTRFDPPWPGLITSTCSSEYQTYINGNSTCPYGTNRCLAIALSDVADCLLQNTPEVWKADMASAAVMLGLLPTILSLAGSSTVEVGLVALRRPFLALLLGTASPAVNPLRTFEYGAPAELLRRGDDAAELPSIPVYLRPLISGVEYVFAFAAIFNIAHVTYSISVRTYTQLNQYVPIVLIWMCLAVAVHILGTLALRLRMNLIAEENPLGIIRATTLKNEFRLSAYHPRSRLVFWRESYWFILLSWVASVSTIIHIALGIYALSSILFINTHDALLIACRCLGSTCVSRVIVMFELSGMRNSVRVFGEKEHPKSEKLYVTYHSSREHVEEERSA